jgi:uncharacterized repeat protein (TIGR01451 family)
MTYPFTGVDGHTYFFRARARDLAGNLSAYRNEERGDAFTTVLLSPAAVTEFSIKSALPFFGLGQPVNYHVVLSNTGNLSGNIFITDTLPLSMTLITETLFASSGAAPIYDGMHIIWNGVITENAAVMISYALTPANDLGLMQPQTNTAVITGGVLPVTRTATTMLALNTYLPIVARNFAP